MSFTVQDLNENSEKNADEADDDAFGETGWVDFTDGYNTRQRKKVKMTLCSCWQLLVINVCKQKQIATLVVFWFGWLFSCYCPYMSCGFQCLELSCHIVKDVLDSINVIYSYS